MKINKPFRTLGRDEKIEFFIKCQELLVQYHPTSEFVLHKSDAQRHIKRIAEIESQYKGHCYVDDNVCALFNYIKITNPSDPVRELKLNIFKEPNANYNAVTVDFVVFRNQLDCMTLFKEVYSSRLEFILYVKNHVPKIYRVHELMSRFLHIPIV